MNKPDLQPGDVFCVRGRGWLSTAIRGVEWVQSTDNEASYGHAGIITSTAGATLEALWVVERGHLDCYAGQPIQIARPVRTIYDDPISLAAKQRAIETLIELHLGQPYPAWRIPLFLFPWMAKFFATGHHLVCSELRCKYLALIGARCLPYTGVNPDTCADEARRWRNIDVIFEGTWPRR